MLYVFDPVAMHNVIVKDQYVFEEAAWFIRWVYRDFFFHVPFRPSTPRTNALAFGPGLLATLGWYLCR